ncbi:uncharacterized protein LOC126263442, partial [Schistocerca nitens]|uniref:uncharacterized protein LOC126263442 n=1 Tax=Schistocerca nitens TaxID=7011 RepID=UPI0021190C2B
RRELQEFIENVNAAFEVVKSEDEKLLFQYVKSKITGEARAKLLVRDRTNDWPEVRSILEENYSDKRTIDFYACRMFQARQYPGESVASWGNRIDELSKSFRVAVTRVTEKAQLKGALELVYALGRACFIQGLVNDRIQTIVRSRGEEISLGDAVEIAQQEESALLSMKEKGQFHKGARRETETRNNWGEKCYNCGKKGHIARECRKPKMSSKVRWVKTPTRAEEARRFQKFCYNCDESGHTDAMCSKIIICEKCQRRGHKATECRTPKCFICNKYGPTGYQCMEKVKVTSGKKKMVSGN